MNLFGWMLKNVAVPLIPFGIGALIRYLSGVHGVKDVFDAGDLCFSMAMLSMLVLSSASRLTDRGLRDSITNGFVLAVVLFIVLFAFTSFARIQIQTETAAIAGRVALGGASSPNYDEEVGRFTRMLGNAWNVVIVPSVVTVVLALICKAKYKLEE